MPLDKCRRLHHARIGSAMQQAVVTAADKTEGKDRDLVHGDGGTRGPG
jgi:hypothetical protein